MISGSAGILCSCLVLAGLPALASASCCSRPPHEEPSDEEIAAVLRLSIAAAGRLSRQADPFLAGVCADTWSTGYARPDC